MERFRPYAKPFILLALVCAVVFVWHVVYIESRPGILTVAFLNVGQGDAIFVESPDHHQIIIDGGPSSKILSELSKVMPFYDRSIDALVVTNPDKDHFAGFLDVLDRYSVGKIFEPGTQSSSTVYATLEKTISEKNIPRIEAKRGMVLHLGNGADLHILFPDQDVSGWSTNDGSMIARLTYGSTSVMFTGDAPNKTEEYVLSLDPERKEIQSTILKAGHHGSRTSASETFVTAVSPEYAVISAGLKNRYNHPHKETTDLFTKLGIPALITFEKGTIIMTSDGTKFEVQYR